MDVNSLKGNTIKIHLSVFSSFSCSCKGQMSSHPQNNSPFYLLLLCTVWKIQSALLRASAKRRPSLYRQDSPLHVFPRTGRPPGRAQHTECLCVEEELCGGIHLLVGIVPARDCHKPYQDLTWFQVLNLFAVPGFSTQQMKQ